MIRVKCISGLPVAPLLLAASIWLGGCSGSSSPAGLLSDSTYVAVMAELISLRNVPGADTALLAKQRAEALTRHNVSPETLEKKSEALASDINRLSALWGAIRVKLHTDTTIR